MTVIGLTGSIGSGKSTVSEYLLRKGYTVIDSDRISRTVVEKGKPALRELAQTFGNKILDKEGNLNRKKLGSIVFKSPHKRAKLEEIVTARVVKEIRKELKNLQKCEDEKIVFIDAPVLFESNAKLPIDYTWVVIADDSVRAKRVMARDNCTFQEFKAKSDSQMSQEEKMKLADRVIDNSGNTRKLYAAVRRLLQEIYE